MSPLKREYIIDRINLRRVQKDCLISYAGNPYSVPAEYVGKDVAVVALENTLAAYYEGKQIALHRISYQRKDMVVNPQHYARLTRKQTMDADITFEKKARKKWARCDRIEDMEYIDLRKVGREGLKEIRRQVVRLKKLGKTGKEIEELTGVRQNRASEIWSAYQREGEASLERKKYGRKPGSCMVLNEEEQADIRKAIEEKRPEDFGIIGVLWTLGRTREYIEKRFEKNINERTLSDYMKRWGMSCQRPAKRARKQNPSGI